MKVKFDTKQPAVQYKEIGNMYIITLYGYETEIVEGVTGEPIVSENENVVVDEAAGENTNEGMIEVAGEITQEVISEAAPENTAEVIETSEITAELTTEETTTEETTESEVIPPEVILSEITTEEVTEESKTEEPKIYYEYDYYCFKVNKEDVDIQDVIENPERYYGHVENIELDDLKKEVISYTKEYLEKYLKEHPIFSSAKYEEGRYYSVTSEKQQHLTSKMLMYTMAAQAGLPYLLTWNDNGNICEEWTFVELSTLAAEIDAFVTPLVTKQQKYEVMVNEVESIEALETLVKFEDYIESNM